MNTSEILVRIIQRIPYPEQAFRFKTDNDSVRFVWRGHQFRVSERLHVETVCHGCLVGSDIAIILQRLLQLETNQ
jgi:hypothetical protein